jgi:3-dehydroquinate synthase
MSVMQTVRVALGERSYDIEIGAGIIDSIGAKLSSLGFSGRAGIVTNETVAPFYAGRVGKSLRDAGIEPIELIMPDGEEYKNLHTVSGIYDDLLKLRFDRKTPLVALGGGVIGDMTGFAADTYMRGIPFVQVPTTLLSQVDSSVGGKTGVNHPLGKNMVGAFYQPVHVCADIETLYTLPEEEFLSGMAEVVKYGVIYDGDFFSYLENNLDAVLAKSMDTMVAIVTKSCKIKAEVVGLDERETNLRAILNFGHTVGHAIEAITNYSGYRHGEAVSIGMAAASRLAARSGLCSPDVPVRVESLLRLLGLPVSAPGISAEAILSAMSLDKKVEKGRVKMVLPKRMGEVVVTADWKESDLVASIN